MSRQPGQAIDQALVEQVKMLRRLDFTYAKIKEQTGLSQATIIRYLKRPDESEVQEDARDNQLEKYADQAGRIVGNLLNKMEKASIDEDIKLKDAAIVTGVLTDKIILIRSKPSDKETKPVVNFNFIVAGQSDSAALPHSDQVPYIDGEISCDGVRPGSGQDVQRMLGSGQEVTGTEV